MGFYRFPAMAKLGEWTLMQQRSKLLEETFEAASEAYELYAARLTHTDHVEDCRRLYGMELMDVIHAAETALRMEFADEEVEKLRDTVEEKNRKRGYYDR